MIPSAINSDYPKFVPNQVLTSDNLNDLFGFLDEQQRITRTNLLGIGIVCGLQVKTGNDANGSFITITKGTGITSRGFLVTVPEITYHQYNSFNAVHPEYYDRFVDIGAKTQKMPLWELKQLGEVEDPDNPFKELSQPSGFLSNKVVLLFVELLETANKNCDPGSCDDKGITVNVNFRALMILKSDLELLNVAFPDCFSSPSFNALAEIVMPRWDVKNNAPVHADDITESYRKIMSGSFISQVQTTLSEAYKLFKPVILDEYPTDPFAEFNLAGQLAFLNNGTINAEQRLHIQYFYDLLSDLSGAYKEFCDTGNEVISCCVPEESAFPRHLLLGEAIPLLYDKSSDYRNYFIYSPLFQQKSLLLKFKLLFRRMVLMLNNFKIPPVVVEGKEKEDTRIRITPSKLADVPLSAKAIPYYYTPKKAPAPLLSNWSAEKTFRGKESQILSYHAEQYFSDDFTLNPLQYDLEPYNFFRIEGIIGKKVGNVLETIKTKISKYRLPIKVVALATGKPGKGSKDECCSLSDLEMQFRLLRQEMISCLQNNITFWGSIEKKKDDRGIIFIEIPDYVYFDKAILFNQAMVKDLGQESVAAAVVTNNEDKIILPEPERKNSSVKSARSITREIFKEQVTMNLAGIYQGYQKRARVDMFALPEPQNVSVAENIPFYALIIIDESEQLADLLDVENIGDFDVKAFAKHVKILHDACSDLSKLVAKFRKTEYLIEKMRVMVDGHDSEIRKIADVMPVMEDGDASKIMILLLNLNSTEEFINDLKGEKDNYEAQKEIIITYFNTLDLDGVMIPINKEPGKFKSKFELMTEQLNNCKCIDFIEKLKFLLERYDEQLSKLKDINNFSVYVKKNPGLQHKAGVTAGGTFIIVYKGDKDSGENIAEDIVLADFFLPYACCSNCTPVEVTFQEAPAVKNQPPVAKAGDSITIELPLNKVNLDGTDSTDPDGSIQSYLWEQAAGPDQAVILDPSSAVTLVSGLVFGEYIFKLTVKDNESALDEDTIKVKVNLAPNIFPTAIAKTDTPILDIAESDKGNLNGKNSFDPDGEIVSYLWTLLPGPVSGVTILNPNEVFTEVKFDQPGTYNFRLAVVDNRNAGATDDVTITVREKVEKTCNSLAKIISAFDNWNIEGEKNKSFQRKFGFYGEVVEYFDQLRKIVGLPVKDQIEFFAGSFNDMPTPDLLKKWLDGLQSIILQNKDLRLIALSLFRVLNQLAMYIVCIQDSDFDQAKIPMNGVFDFIRDCAMQWMEIRDQLQDTELNMIKNIAGDIQEEMKRVNENGEGETKKHYLNALEEIVKILTPVM